jgi:D-3-phosphoglycerate dehydrogenase
MRKALVTTVPFGDSNRLPLDLLEKAGIDQMINPVGRKLKENELADYLMNCTTNRTINCNP